MKKLIFIQSLLFLLISSNFSQWVSNFGGITAGDLNLASAKGNAVTTDNQGNSYVTGFSYETGYGNDIITIKYNSAGGIIWAKGFNGTDSKNDEGTAIYVDNTGNVYVVGSVQNTLRSYDIILLKYDSTGNYVWDQIFYTASDARIDKGTAIAADAAGSIYVTGYTTTTDGYQDLIVLKYNPSGIFQWQFTEDGESNLNSQGLTIAVGSSGNIYAAGYVTVSGSGNDAVVIKLNQQGEKQWLRQINGNYNGEDKAWGIAVDQTDNVILTGYVTDSYNNTNIFTSKYNTSGDYLWSSFFNGSGNEIDKAWGVVVDTDGSIYIIGQTEDIYHNTDYITIGYDIYGVMLWNAVYNGTANGADIASAIGIVNSQYNGKSVVVTGKSWGINNNYDYATVRYTISTGIQTQVNRYSMTGITNDIAKDIAVSPEDKVFVTGYSQLIIESNIEESYISTLMFNWGNESELTLNNTIPSGFVLNQNYPNPFNPSTNISFEIITGGVTKLSVYDVLGKEIDVLVNQELKAGSYSIKYTNKQLSSGIYFYELKVNGIREIKKMTLVK